MKKWILFLIVASFATVSFAQTNTMNEKKAPPTIRFTCPMHHDIIRDAAGKCPKCGMELVAMSPPVKYVCPMHSNVISKEPGKCPVCGMALVAQKNEKITVVKYSCPMHADMISDKPGKCPKCGMAMVETKK